MYPSILFFFSFFEGAMGMRHCRGVGGDGGGDFTAAGGRCTAASGGGSERSAFPLAQLNRHGYGVRRIKFSPHQASWILSCSYDMAVCVWDYQREDALLSRYDHHTEFAVGIDMSVLVEGLLASTGWDAKVYVWQHGTDPRRF